MTRGRNEWIEEGCFGCAELVGLFAPPNEFDAFKTRVLASVNFRHPGLGIENRGQRLIQPLFVPRTTAESGTWHHAYLNWL